MGHEETFNAAIRELARTTLGDALAQAEPGAKQPLLTALAAEAAAIAKPAEGLGWDGVAPETAKTAFAEIAGLLGVAPDDASRALVGAGMPKTVGELPVPIPDLDPEGFLWRAVLKGALDRDRVAGAEGRDSIESLAQFDARLGSTAFEWMVEHFMVSSLWDQFTTRGVLDDETIDLIAGTVGDLSRRDERRGLLGVDEAVAKLAFFRAMESVSVLDHDGLEKAWARRPAIVPVLEKWMGVDVRTLSTEWNAKASPALSLKTAWERHRKEVEAERDATSELRAAEASGLVSLPDLSSRFSSICETLRNPRACQALFGGSSLAFNLLTSRVEIDRQTTGERSAEDLVSEIREHVEQRLGVPREDDGRKYIERVSWPVEDTYRAVIRVSKEGGYHPVRDYLNGLKWDGVERLALVMRDGFGIAEPDELEVKMVRWALQQAVARAMEPGCKADYMLVLVSDQGDGKSTRIHDLPPDPTWATDDKVKPNDRDNYLTLHSKWIGEWGELAGLAKREAEEVKNFLTKRSDNYRAPYDRETQDHPRAFVFIGTTNDWEFLKGDPTGYRRYWPVRVRGEQGKAWLIANRDQLWAEATEAYRRGERRWPDAAESRALAQYIARYTKDLLAPGEDDFVVEAAEAAYHKSKGAAVQREDVMDKIQEAKGDLPPEVRTEYRKSVLGILRKAGWRSGESTIDGHRKKGLLPPPERARQLVA